MSEPTSTENSDGSEDGLAFLRSRLRLLGASTFTLSFGFLALQTLIDLSSGGLGLAAAELAKPGRYLNAAAAAVSLLLYAIVRLAPLARTGLRVADASATVLAATLYACMALVGEEGMVAVLLASLCTLLVLLLRAVLIPSSWERTAAVSGASAVVILVLGFVLDPARAGDDPAELRIALSMWLMVAVVVSTVLSGVLFGLRRAVRDARKLGQYTLTERLGKGGMGEVYRAEHAFLRRPTAVKLLPHTADGDAAAKRFEKEVQLTASLIHPNTVRIFDYGRTPDGVFYYAMELVEGGDLDAMVQASGPQPAARVAYLMAQVAGSLSEAHDVGLIHRDIKPANILVSCRGVYDLVKVADFGLVREVTEADPTESRMEIVGTPQFMAPETFTTPETVDGRADLYALGAVGYYLLTGRHVFERAGTLQILAAHATAPPEAPSTLVSSVPPALEAILLQLLEKEPTSRFESAQALARALAPIAADWSPERASAWWQTHEGAVRARESLPYALTVARGSRG